MTITSADFFAQQSDYIDELDQLVSDINTNAASKSYVDLAVAGGSLTASSVTSNTIGTGAKTFTIEAGRAYTVGMVLRISYTTTPTNYMKGYITAYSGTTLSITVTDVNGSGTYASWSIGLEGGTATTQPQYLGHLYFFSSF